MPPARFEPAIPASERPQTHALDGATTGIRLCIGYCNKTNRYRKTSNFRNIFILQLTEIFFKNLHMFLRPNVSFNGPNVSVALPSQIRASTMLLLGTVGN
jgi:hypothetical protein